MDSIHHAAENFDLGFSCSQSILRAFSAELGLDPDTAARAAAAFGGGMGRTGRTCGAISGALMVIGLRAGSADPTDKEAKEHIYALTRQFLDDFSQIHHATDCLGLLNHDLSTPTGLQEARDHGVFKTLCPVFVRDAARLAAKILETEE